MAFRYFVFLYPEDQVIQELLDLAVFLLNPSEKWRAHVTLAGPFISARNLPRKTEFKRKVSLLGVGEFRSEKQNTVFLRVGAPDLREFWNKPDYPFNPHLTLYDGSNTSLADALFESLRELRMFFKFYVSQVHIVRTMKGQGSIDLAAHINTNALPQLRGTEVGELRGCAEQERMFYAVEALKRAKYESGRLRQPF